MKRNVTAYTALMLIFLLLLTVSGSTEGTISELIYIIAFIAPVVIGYAIDKKRREQESQHDREYKEPDSYFKLSGGSVRLFASWIFPTVALIMTISQVTAMLLFLVTGTEHTLDVGNNLIFALARHAVLPAFLEEALFRFMPLRMLSRHSASATVIISSLYFALIHNSFYSIPYAFVAGVAFITVDLVCESVWPSVVLHFINNAASVIWIMYSGTQTFAVFYYGTVAALTLVSLAVIFIRRKEYNDKIHKTLSYGEKMPFMYEPLLLAVPTLLMAVTEFI